MRGFPDQCFDTGYFPRKNSRQIFIEKSKKQRYERTISKKNSVVIRGIENSDEKRHRTGLRDDGDKKLRFDELACAFEIVEGVCRHSSCRVGSLLAETGSGFWAILTMQTDFYVNAKRVK